MWFFGVEVEQETTAPPPKKNPGSAPEIRLDLTWNYHIDYIYGKAAKWLYSLILLKRAVVAGRNITNIISALWDHLYLHMLSRHGKIFLRP